MILYGTKINADIELPLHYDNSAATKYEINFSSKIPYGLKKSITCGFHFYVSHGRNVYLYSNREFEGNQKEQPWCYEVENIVKFYWVSGERSIYYELDDKGDLHLLSFWFAHLFLPLYMTMEEMYDFIHAGAVTVEGRSVFFIAPSMGGKSTMTKHFLSNGHSLVSDDKVATFFDSGQFMAVGSHPYYRPYRKFEELGYCAKNFVTTFTPISVFYELEGIDATSKMVIKEVKGFSKFDVILPNYLYLFKWLKHKRLDYLSKMLNEIRVFHVQVPWDKNRLSEVHSLLCSHSKGIR